MGLTLSLPLLYGPVGAVAPRPLRSAASTLHSALCPAFQCATWHSRPQYLATPQLAHVNSLPAAAAAPDPAAMSAVAHPQWLQTYTRIKVGGGNS